MADKKIQAIENKFHKTANALGSLFITFFHYAALFGIGAVIAWAAFLEFRYMFDHNEFKIANILTLFIFLELGAMVGIYFKTKHMPVRYLIYIAITALTRLLILGVSEHNPSMEAGWRIIIESGAILLLCVAVLIVRLAAFRYPSALEDAEDQV